MNKRVKVCVTEVLQRIIEVETEDEAEAVEYVENSYNEEEIILDASDFIEVRIEVCE